MTSRGGWTNLAIWDADHQFFFGFCTPLPYRLCFPLSCSLTVDLPGAYPQENWGIFGNLFRHTMLIKQGHDLRRLSAVHLIQFLIYFLLDESLYCECFDWTGKSRTTPKGPRCEDNYQQTSDSDDRVVHILRVDWSSGWKDKEDANECSELDVVCINV